MTRKRWVYTKGGQPLPEPFEVGEEWENTTGRCDVVTDLYMDGVRATDGTDIGSRAKRREYMKTNSLADAGDFKGAWEKSAQERAEFFNGKQKDKDRREIMGRALYARKRK